MRRRQQDDLERVGIPCVRGPLFDMDEGPFAHSQIDPTMEEVLIGSVIWKHKGRNNPISIARLREMTKLSERQIKGVVEQLVVSHKLKIGGRREDPVGYFVIQDAEDLAAAVGPYKAQILAMWRRLRVLEQPGLLREFLGQLSLED